MTTTTKTCCNPSLRLGRSRGRLRGGRDKLGNHVANAHFADRSDELRVVSTICLEHTLNGFYEADIKDYARIYPFSYIAEDWSRLRRFILPLSLQSELRRCSDQFFRNGSADTHALLVDMTQTIRRTFRHVARHEKGIQDTATRKRGSSRDVFDLSEGHYRHGRALSVPAMSIVHNLERRSSRLHLRARRRGQKKSHTSP